METLLVKCIQKSLDQYMFRNSIFLSERLCAEFPSEVNLQLLARCYLSNDQAYNSYCVLKGLQTDQSRYLFAISCFKMDRLSEAEAALLPTNVDTGEVPNGAAGHYILGLIYRYGGRTKCSAQHFRKALLIDPLFWAAYEELCTLGEAEDAGTIFGEEAINCILELHLDQASRHPKDMHVSHLPHLQESEVKDNNRNHCGAATSSGNAVQFPNGYPPNLPICSTPSPVITQFSDLAPPPIRRNIQIGADGDEGTRFGNEYRSTEVPIRLFSDSGLRRSARVAAQKKSSTSVDGKGIHSLQSPSKSHTSSFRSSMNDKGQSENTNKGKFPQTPDDATSENTATSAGVSFFAAGRSLHNEATSTEKNEIITNTSSIISGITDTLDLLRHVGEGYRLLCTYRCQDSINVFQKLSLKQYNTVWVLSQVGKAHFELVDYLKADSAFSLARQIFPCALEGMDIFSTVLYHLKEENKLRYLAQELLSIDRLAPESWIAIGNCYGLQKNNETALKFFTRAVKLKSRFAYAHTLCGHEYVQLEDYENGIRCYQRALLADTRHYNAWYGLGMIYLCQENYGFAEHHFRQALRIHSQSSVIMCYIGIALHALKRNEEALEMLENAILIDPKNPLSMYYKADILRRLENFEKALEVLEELKELVCESSVYALMGKIYKECNLYDRAIFSFGIALDLKPSMIDAAKIKACMEDLSLPDNMEDDL